jgi:tRNA(Arg) A34 adenosine deaminase TadA
MRLKWKLVSVLLDIVLILTQDSCMVCVESTISLEILLDAPDGNPRWRGSSENTVRLDMVLILTHDRCMICVERTIASEIILDALDGTPR